MDRWYIFVAQNNVWIEGEIMLFQTIGNELNPVILVFSCDGCNWRKQYANCRKNCQINIIVLCQHLLFIVQIKSI